MEEEREIGLLGEHVLYQHGRRTSLLLPPQHCAGTTAVADGNEMRRCHWDLLDQMLAEMGHASPWKILICQADECWKGGDAV